MPIEVRDVSYIYMPGTPYETKALDGVTLSIRDGERLAIVEYRLEKHPGPAFQRADPHRGK